MLTSTKRAALLAVVGALVCFPHAARAQFRMGPANLNGVAPPGAGTGGCTPFGSAFFGAGFNPGAAGLASGFNPGASGFNPYLAAGTMSSTNGGYGSLGNYGGYGGYGLSYYGEAGGALIGVSSVIDASGQLQVQTQQARIIQQKAQRERIATRRYLIEQWLWERNNLPTAQDEFERIQRISLQRMQNDPPLTEIVSGQALNELLTDVQKHLGAVGPDFTLSDDVLRKINVTPGGKSVNLGILKNNGKLSWPIALKSGTFARERELLTQLSEAAFNEAAKGRVDAAIVIQMDEAVDRMLADLAGNIREMVPAKYIAAKRFLYDLKEASHGLQRNDVASFFNNKYAARGRTVKELCDNMRNEGLKFAPYSAGNEAAYAALHRVLAAYDVAINGAVADRR
jgi:hypothetical protein